MPGTTLERVLTLPPEPASASAARRALRELLDECGHEEWLDTAELAVSELVTNVVLHAHTPLTLRATCNSHLRVEVTDSCPALPTQRSYGTQATTGRGMGLVAAITDEHGVTPLAAGGKVVWFVVHSSSAAEEAEELGDWSDIIAELEQPPTAGTQQVQLPGLPTTLWLAAEQRHDALLRELALIRRSDEPRADDLSAADAARAMLSSAALHALAAAKDRGDARNPLPSNHPAPLEDVPPTLDVDLHLTPEDGEGFGALQDVLDEAERMATRGQLLTRPGLPEVIALRDWACEQVIAQLNGQDPSPWQGTDAERFTDLRDHDDWPAEWDGNTLLESPVGVVAADDSNRIIGISRMLADELGWDPADLVGRRVVAIVPPQFREAHVAGFTRHLTTGQAHALGVDLDLPVLRADGSEVLCAFFIEALRTPNGRTVYVSRITPKETA